jgi:hypothetical protein
MPPPPQWFKNAEAAPNYQQRFTIQWAKQRIHNKFDVGWVVFDMRMPITVPIDDFTVALRRRDNIAKIYAHYGW